MNDEEKEFVLMDKGHQLARFDVMKDQTGTTFGIMCDEPDDLPKLVNDRLDMAIHNTELPSLLNEGERIHHAGVVVYEPNGAFVNAIFRDI
jgi:hypothetical protein